MRFLVTVFTLMLLVPLPTAADVLSADSVAAHESPDLPKKCYAVFFTTGPRFTHETSPDGLPGMRAHVKYIKSLFADGVVPLAGPLFEDEEMTRVSGALYFVYAANLEEARALVMREPLVQERVVEISSISLFLAGVGTLDQK